jgi:hypothetical protein
VAALLLVPLGAVAAALARPTGLRNPIWAHGALWAATGLFLGLPAILPRGTLSFFSPDMLNALALRVPGRLTIGAMFGFALLAGAGFAACTRALAGPGNRPRSRALARGVAALAVVAVVYAEYLGYPLHPSFGLGPVPASYPLLALEQPDPDLMRKIRETPGALLEFPPYGDVTSPPPHALAMYRSIFHWRPLLNGYSSYWPPGFPRRMALAARLPDPDAVDVLRAETGMTMVLVPWTLLTRIGQARWVHIAAGEAASVLEPVMWKHDGLLFVVRADAPPPVVAPPTPVPSAVDRLRDPEVE